MHLLFEEVSSLSYFSKCTGVLGPSSQRRPKPCTSSQSGNGIELCVCAFPTCYVCWITEFAESWNPWGWKSPLRSSPLPQHCHGHHSRSPGVTVTNFLPPRRDGDPTTALGSLCQCLTNLSLKIFSCYPIWTSSGHFLLSCPLLSGVDPHPKNWGRSNMCRIQMFHEPTHTFPSPISTILCPKLWINSLKT